MGVLFPTSSQVGPHQWAVAVGKWYRVSWQDLPSAYSVALGRSHLAPQTCVCVCGVAGSQIISLWIMWGFILLTFPVFHLKLLGTWRTRSLIIKDWSREVTKYFILSLILCCYISLHIIQRMEVLLSPLFAVSMFIEVFFIVIFSSRRIKF